MHVGNLSELMEECICQRAREKLQSLRQEMKHFPEMVHAVDTQKGGIAVELDAAFLEIACEVCDGSGYVLTAKGKLFARCIETFRMNEELGRKQEEETPL